MNLFNKKNIFTRIKYFKSLYLLVYCFGRKDPMKSFQVVVQTDPFPLKDISKSNSRNKVVPNIFLPPFRLFSLYFHRPDIGRILISKKKHDHMYFFYHDMKPLNRNLFFEFQRNKILNMYYLFLILFFFFLVTSLFNRIINLLYFLITFPCYSYLYEMLWRRVIKFHAEGCI